MTNSVHEILHLARIYAASRGHSLNTVSLRMAGQGSLFGRLEQGLADVTTRRCDRILQAFSDHWPAKLEWPPDIPRPAPSPALPRKRGKAA